MRATSSGVYEPQCGEHCDGATPSCSFGAFQATGGVPGTPDECTCCAPTESLCGGNGFQLLQCCGGEECVNFGPTLGSLRGWWYCVTGCSAQEDCAAGSACVCGHCFPAFSTCTQDADCGSNALCLSGDCLGSLYTCDLCTGGADYDCISGLCVPRVCPPMN